MAERLIDRVLCSPSVEVRERRAAEIRELHCQGFSEEALAERFHIRKALVAKVLGAATGGDQAAQLRGRIFDLETALGCAIDAIQNLADHAVSDVFRRELAREADYLRKVLGPR